MISKSAEKFYLTMEVNMDSMTVSLIKDGKEGRTYDANRYFQYFLEYGVRKVDVAQLKEHFSIEFFQNMLMTGKSSEAFEFCVKFALEDYKILQCKMRVIEKEHQNVLHIILEDISHKRVQQLIYIRNHYEKSEHKSYAKPFDVQFEEEHNTKNSLRKYKQAIILAGILCVVISIIFFHYMYQKNVKYSHQSVMNSCKETSQCLTQQINYYTLNLLALKSLISNMGAQLSKEQLIEYIREQKERFDCESIVLIDEDKKMFYVDENDRGKRSRIWEKVTNDGKRDNIFIFADKLEGITTINYLLPLETTGGASGKYQSFGVAFDLNRICSTAALTGGNRENDILVLDKSGQILWTNNQELMVSEYKKNLYTYLKKNKAKIKEMNMPVSFRNGSLKSNSAIFRFTMGGKQSFIAYTPLNVKGLYMVSMVSEDQGISTEMKYLGALMAIWLIILMFPLLLLIYQRKRLMEEKQRLEKLAFADELTGGMNLNYFNEKASELIKDMKYQYALVVTSLSDFNIYREKYGVERSDELICKIYSGISKSIEAEELLCRADGDNTLSMMKFQGNVQLEERLSDISLCIMDTNFELEYGVCVVRDFTMELNVAKERAVAALKNKEKTKKKNAVISYYDINLLNQLKFEKELENTIYNAFRNGEFKIAVSPRYSLKNRAICNGDAYALWEHPDKGILHPEQYVGIFEKRGLMMSLDTFVFEGVCKKMSRHIEEGKTCMNVSLALHCEAGNLESYLEKLHKIKARYSIPDGYLSFELEEATIYEKRHHMNEIVELIHKMGVDCIMGEYKGNYISPEMLCSLKLDGIKIPPSFFCDNLPKEMVAALVKIGKSIKARMIAVKVHDKGQIQVLLEANCDEAKGDAFTKDISLHEYINIL